MFSKIKNIGFFDEKTLIQELSEIKGKEIVIVKDIVYNKNMQGLFTFSHSGNKDSKMWNTTCIIRDAHNLITKNGITRKEVEDQIKLSYWSTFTNNLSPLNSRGLKFCLKKPKRLLQSKPYI